MPYIKIHQDKAQDKEKLAAICPFKAIEIVNGELAINSGCRMCRLCVKNSGGVFEYVEDRDSTPAVDKAQWRGIAVVAEITEGAVHPVTFERIGKARELAAKVKYPVYCLMIGYQISGLAKKILEYGADEVFVYDLPELQYFRIEPYTAVVEDFIRKVRPSSVLVGGTVSGRSLAPRLAARLGTGLTADCTALAVDPQTRLLLQTRPAFGGNLMATIVCPDRRPQMATVRPKVFPTPVPDPGRTWKLIAENSPDSPRAFEWLERLASADDSDIGEADVLVSVGQGIGGAENIALAEKLARRLHGTLASSRPLVDSGVMPYPRQVGQTGKTVSPRLYLALGISGAIQHMAGVSARTLVAVNTDPDAPIRGYADIFIPCDCGAFLRSVLDLLA